MQITNLAILLVIIVLFMSISYKIAENFGNIDNPYLPDKYLHQYVNANILDHSVKCNDAKVQEYVQSTLCGEECAMNAIRYVEGVTWTNWMYQCNNNIKEIGNRLQLYLKKKLSVGKDIEILYAKATKYRKNTKNPKEVMIDYDFVYHDKKDMYAYHVNLVCVVCLGTKYIKMVYVYLVGAISEDKIYMKTGPKNQDMVQVHQKYHSVPDMAFEPESQKCISTQDTQVKDILYDKLKDNSYENDEDYQKNQEYIRNQNIVRNMFLSNLKKEVKTTNKFKRYPYTNDFEVCVS